MFLVLLLCVLGLNIATKADTTESVVSQEVQVELDAQGISEQAQVEPDAQGISEQAQVEPDAQVNTESAEELDYDDMADDEFDDEDLEDIDE